MSKTPQRIIMIMAAIVALDKNNPSNFLADGVTPQIDALEEATGYEDITAAERTEALNQVNESESSTPPVEEEDEAFKNSTFPISGGEKILSVKKETIVLIGKTMVRVKEGEEQKAWGSSFTALKVMIEDPETGEDSEKMVLLGEFERNGHEHVSLMEAKPRRGIVFNGEILSK